MVKYQKTVEQIAGVALIGAIVAGCGFVLRPFVSAILWAAILCFATWPLHELLLKGLRGRRNLAAGIMTALLSLFLIIPFVLVGLTFTDSVRTVMKRLDSDKQAKAVETRNLASLRDPDDPVEETRDFASLRDSGGQAQARPDVAAEPNAPESEPSVWAQDEPNRQAEIAQVHVQEPVGLPPPPEWVERIPLVGGKVSEYWSTLSESTEPAISWLRPSFKAAGRWLLQHSLDFAHGLLDLVLSVLIAFFLYRDGEGLVARLREGFQRISGDSAQRLMNVVQTTVRSVVYGVIGTALGQGIVAGIGFVIAGVPAPMLLALLTFFLSFIPFGPPIVWIGAAVWLFVGGWTGWGIFMVVYGLLGISSVDNLIKPYIISRGSKLSFIVMFIGVLGGVAAFGFIGVFLGPTLLAVGFSLAQEILEQRRYSPAPKPVPAPVPEPGTAPEHPETPTP